MVKPNRSWAHEADNYQATSSADRLDKSPLPIGADRKPGSSATQPNETLLESATEDIRNNVNSISNQEIRPLSLQVNEAIATLNRLQVLNLSNLDVPLPRCIVLGEQSTGKSSVIEAISGIRTPRSTDTCTRCPLYIKLEPSKNPACVWSASVSLQRSYKWTGLVHRGSTQPYHEWVDMKEMEEIPFGATKSPTELEDLIARAQLATISPLIDYQQFLRSPLVSRTDDHRCEFSPNVVSITITQADVAALSFFDLPGIISQAESAGTQFLVEFVRTLVTEYVRREGTLVLVTCSLENDIANSAAGGIARSSNATDRCIGVLTKPDRLPAGTRPEKLREIFEQKRFALGHGYFVVKNLGQDEIDQGITHAEARLRENSFFEMKAPWSTSLKEYHPRFGTLRLQSFLSKTLAEHVTAKLPVIHEEINNRLSQVKLDLEQYPEPPTMHASRIIGDAIAEFSDHVKAEILAEFPCNQWSNTWGMLQQVFFDALVSIQPTMKINGQRDSGVYAETLASTGHSAEDSIVIDDEDGCEDNGQVHQPRTPSKKRKIEEAPTPSPSPMKPLLSSQRANGVQSSSHDYSRLRTIFRLDDVAKHLQESSKSRIPGQIEPRVIYAMMLETLQNWEDPLGGFFTALEVQLHKTIKNLFHGHFGKWLGSPLYCEAWKIVEGMLGLNFHQQRTLMAAESLADEKEGPYIFHNGIFESEKAVFMEKYRRARFVARLKIYKQERIALGYKEMTPQEEQRLRKDERTISVLNREPYDIELGVVASVVTYYVTAARRFHDAVCMRVESKFFKQLRTQLRDELENGLGLYDGNEGPQNAIRLLAEPPERELKRKELVQMKKSLLQGQQILNELQQKKYNDGAEAQTSTDVSQGGGSALDMSTSAPEDVEDMSLDDEV